MFPPVAAEGLASRTFTFSAGPAGSVISERFVFHRNGFIVGYSHRNEAFWELDDGDVNILDSEGRVTCRLSGRMTPDGRLRLEGYFRNPVNGYEQTDALHVVEENGSDYHAGIQSFDVFDTLVARRCYGPLEIFRAVETKSGIANFADLRHRAEMSMFGNRTYGLDEIYQILVGVSFLTPRQAEVLKLMELEEEWDNLFPVAEVVARVNPGDIIISDMYLPKPFVERVLREKCGLDNTLYLSNYGKHHREIWPVVQKDHRLRVHFGDNLRADIVGPASFGIEVNLVQISKWDPSEEILHSAGLASYAHAVRETRL